MKKITFALLTLFFAVTVYGQTTIENPEFGYSTASNAYLKKIEIRDTATVLSFHTTTTPGNWIFIPKETYIQPLSGGDKLFVLSATGIPLGGKYIMPASGEVDYQLVFPKIDKSVSKLNYGEANNGGSWFIYDIRLTSLPDKFNTIKEPKGNLSGKGITCVIKGKVIGRNSRTIILMIATEDPRFAKTIIPVRDSTFEYKLLIPQTEAYALVFSDEMDKGSWRPIYLFPENGEINCKLYPIAEYEKNQITGGKLNSEFAEYQKGFEKTFMSKYQPFGDSIQALIKRNEYYSDEAKNLQTEAKNTKDNETRVKIYKKLNDLRSSGNDLSDKGKTINEKIELVKQIAVNWRYRYIEQNPSIISYYLLLQDLQSVKYDKSINIDDIQKNYGVLSKKFPNHPYNQLIKILLDSYATIRVGGRFIDFQAPDLNGNIFKLSKVINDKIALIDLWATWCGPCIMASRSMIPVFEEFKDRGFTICGVAAEIYNTDRLVKTLAKEKFPWLNLVELDHTNKIWYKYGIPNAGGGTFLVDREGIILAISPTADEVRKILKEKLK
jgi:thiol-disulfide isomerase/thioredoxin